MRLCEQCGSELPTWARRHTRTCSTRCRVALHRTQQPPAELRQRDRWVRRSADKCPLTVDGRAASSTDASTWASYAVASRSAAGVGLGYVLAAGDEVVCLDLDHCVDANGRVADWAQEILDRCPPTFVELSPSGRGLHIWGRADLPRGRVLRRGGAHVEVYGAGRYIALGRRWSGPNRLADLSEVVAELP